MRTVIEPGIERATLWRLLSLGFAPPREETLAEVEVLAAVLLDEHEQTDVAGVLDAARRDGLEAIAPAYHRLFGGTVQVAPYEGSYELDPVRQGRQLADVAAFYRAFGAAAHGPASERPDHVGCELEFLAFLELRRLAAVEEGDEPGAALLEKIAADFVVDHAGRWLPTFFADVRQEAGRAPFYEALAALGARVVRDEIARTGREPSPLPRRHRRGSVEADALACG